MMNDCFEISQMTCVVRESFSVVIQRDHIWDTQNSQHIQCGSAGRVFFFKDTKLLHVYLILDTYYFPIEAEWRIYASVI